MAITTEAIYEAGVLRPLEPLDALEEHQRVRITVQSVDLVAEQRQQQKRLLNPLSTTCSPSEGMLHAIPPGAHSAL
jgi:predicted DNA-binding antitoxin AbrB/MazE fold protein